MKRAHEMLLELATHDELGSWIMEIAWYLHMERNRAPVRVRTPPGREQCRDTYVAPSPPT